MDLLGMIAGTVPAATGVEVRRCRIWISALVAVLMVLVTVWFLDHMASGRTGSMRPKAMLAAVIWPFMTAWWIWNTYRAVQLRGRGHFGWALSDEHFLFVPPGGLGIGQIRLADIASIQLLNVPRVGKVLELQLNIKQDGKPATLVMELRALADEQIGLQAIRPSGSKTLFKALSARLRANNHPAKIHDQVLSAAR
jgi:hypothetical protein